MQEIKESSPAAGTAKLAIETLRRILPVRSYTHGTFALHLSPESISRLVCEHMAADKPSAAMLRWYPSFDGSVEVSAINVSHVNLSIHGTYKHGTAPLHDTHWERRTVQDALHVLLHMLTHSVQHAYARERKRAA